MASPSRPTTENIQIAKTTLSVHEELSHRLAQADAALRGPGADRGRLGSALELDRRQQRISPGARRADQHWATTTRRSSCRATTIRGYDWTVSYYHVAAADYQHFDAQ